MLGGVLILILTGLIAFVVIDHLKGKYPWIDTGLLRNLFFYHFFLLIAYYSYILINGSDAIAYYQKVVIGYRGETWGDFYGTSTTFIEFVGYPFIRFLGFSFEAIMALFSFLGYLGFVYFYIFFKENLRFKHTFLGFDLLTLFFFLPNLHFWSTSFGKGSIIFLGLGLFFYGISKVNQRIVAIVIGGIIIYHVRPHIMLIVIVSSAISFVFSSRGVSVAWRVLFLAGATVAFFFIYQDVLSLIGIDEEEFVTQGLDLTHRASELSKATSGIDISNYSLPAQLFTFLYRPLFFDAPGILGIVVSFENVFYLMITLQMLTSLKGLKFLIQGNTLTKSAFISFLTVSIALAQISGNLGLAMRQKSQIMILFMFVIISFLDEQKLVKWEIAKKRKIIADRIRRNSANAPST
jgi:hypothetical protein